METDMTSSTPRIAIVTGGSRGIGRAIVRRLADAGYGLVVNYTGNQTEADAAVAEATAAGAHAIAAQADVADEHAVAAMFDLAEESFGGIDVVIHAAGRMELAPLAELDLDSLDRQHRVNIRGTFVVDQQAVRRLRPGGAIINFSSSVVKIARPTYAAYAASKAAVEGLTLTLAHELRGQDITVNAVAPGPTATALFLEGKDDALLERIANEPPLERLGTPEDSATVAVFLASPEGHWVNGQVIRVNGGIV
jgi:3-oxoacyl-[acyl-carrier protein] reductase